MNEMEIRQRNRMVAALRAAYDRVEEFPLAEMQKYRIPGAERQVAKETLQRVIGMVVSLRAKTSLLCSGENLSTVWQTLTVGGWNALRDLADANWSDVADLFRKREVTLPLAIVLFHQEYTILLRKEQQSVARASGDKSFVSTQAVSIYPEQP